MIAPSADVTEPPPTAVTRPTPLFEASSEPPPPQADAVTAAIKITSEIPYEATNSGFAVEDLLLRWVALIFMAVVFLMLTAVQVSRRRSG